MKYRTVDLQAAGELSGSSGTEIIPIRVKDIISRISIYWQVTMADENMDSYQHRDITKIELVNGSDVLHSLNGGQNQALAIYDRKIPTMNYRQKLNANSLASNYAIDFGRFLHDPMLALDPARFDNLQLKISWNEALANTSASANELEVKAEVFDEATPSPIGFLMAKEHYSALSPASGYRYIDLPTDHVLRKLLIQGYYASYEPWYSVAEARLDEDNEKRIPFDWNIERYYRMMQGLWTPIEDQFVVYISAAGANSFYFTPTDYYVVVDGNDYGGQGVAWGTNGIVRGGVMTPTGASAVLVMGTAKGYMPNHCVEFPFGDPQDLEDWYDITKLGSLRLRLKAGSGGATGSQAVVLQQLRRY